MEFATEKGQLIFRKVDNYIENDKNRGGGHGIDHIMRVWEMGIRIGREEGADLEVLEPALLLHDIIHEKGKSKEHCMMSAELSAKMLQDLGYKDDKITRICNAIARHSRSDVRGGAPVELEDKILYDADKADGVGEDALQRVLDINRKKGREDNDVEWYLNRIMDICANGQLFTRTGKAIANSRIPESLAFCKRMLGGEKFCKILKECGFESEDEVKF